MQDAGYGSASANVGRSLNQNGPAAADGVDAINANLSMQNNRLLAVLERLDRIANRLHGFPPTDIGSAKAVTQTQSPTPVPSSTRDWLGATASVIDKIENQIHRIQPDA